MLHLPPSKGDRLGFCIQQINRRIGFGFYSAPCRQTVRRGVGPFDSVSFIFFGKEGKFHALTLGPIRGCGRKSPEGQFLRLTWLTAPSDEALQPLAGDLKAIRLSGRHGSLVKFDQS